MLKLNVTRRHTMGLLAGGAGALLARTGLTGPTADVSGDAGDFHALQEAMRGSVTAKGDDHFDAARRAMVWNRRVANERVPGGDRSSGLDGRMSPPRSSSRDAGA